MHLWRKRWSGWGNGRLAPWDSCLRLRLSSPKIRLPLTEEDLEQLAGLGEHLGYLDVDMQERTLGLYLEQLDISIEYLRTNQREKCRLYTSLGIMGGMFLVIVMY